MISREGSLVVISTLVRPLEERKKVGRARPPGRGVHQWQAWCQRNWPTCLWFAWKFDRRQKTGGGFRWHPRYCLACFLAGDLAHGGGGGDGGWWRRHTQEDSERTFFFFSTEKEKRKKSNDTTELRRRSPAHCTRLRLRYRLGEVERYKVL